MITNEITLTENYVFEDNESLIRRGSITVANCKPQAKRIQDLSCNTMSSCGSDSMYFQPFITGDKLYFQFQHVMQSAFDDCFQPKAADRWYTTAMPYPYLCIPEIYDLDGTLLLRGADVIASNYGVGIDSNGNGYQWLTIDTETLVTADCFILKVVFKDEEWYSEPYKRMDAECDNLVEFIATYPAYDSNDSIYKQFDANTYNQNNNDFTTKFSVVGEFIKTGEDINTELSDRNMFATSGTINSIYRLRTEPIPQFMAERIAVASASPNLYIDGIPVYFTGKIDKNNDDGLSWVLIIEYSTYKNETYFDCK